MDFKETIERIIRKVADQNDKSLVAEFTDETMLLQSGLDSLDFAVVIAYLKEELDWIWDTRNKMHYFQVDEREFGVYKYADHVRTATAIRKLIESLRAACAQV